MNSALISIGTMGWLVSSFLLNQAIPPSIVPAFATPQFSPIQPSQPEPDKDKAPQMPGAPGPGSSSSSGTR